MSSMSIAFAPARRIVKAIIRRHTSIGRVGNEREDWSSWVVAS